MKFGQFWEPENERVRERLALSMERIEQIYKDTMCVVAFQDYFKRTSL